MTDALAVQYRSVDTLIPYARNARQHSAAQVAELAGAIAEFGWTNPILVDETGNIIAGHGRLLAARQLEMLEVPTIQLSGLSAAQRRALVLFDNKSALNATWDLELLKIELDDIQGAGFSLDFTGFSMDEIKELFPSSSSTGGSGPALGSLADRFGIPPFTVLNAREGWWQDRKAAWIALGIESEVGRGANLLKMSETVLNAGKPKGKKASAIPGGGGGGVYGKNGPTDGYIPGQKKTDARATGTQAWVAGKIADGDIAGGMSANQSGTSIFDPVLCELAYRWFSPAGGVVLDPFAGGSVRGIVAAKLNRQYVGLDLRPEQVQANEAQWDKIGKPSELHPRWIIGDSCDIQKLAEGTKADFLFSCPPYAYLERYSNDALDLSTMTWDAFQVAYRKIIAGSCAMLEDDTFACFVVGDVRDKDGNYLGFPWATIQAFQDAGLKLYNEAVLVTSVGSLPIRINKQFTGGRKLGKTHQNVLVFLKGNSKKAVAKLGDVEFGDPAAFAAAFDPEALHPPEIKAPDLGTIYGEIL